MVFLNDKEIKKLEVIKMVKAREITKKDAADKLQLSIKQVRRLIVKLETEGEEGFAHKSRGKEMHNKLPEEDKENIINLYLTKYYDYNFAHFYEETGKEVLNASFSTVCSVLNEADIISPDAQRKTVKLYNEKMRNAIKTGKTTKEQLKLYKKRQELEKEKHIRKSTVLYSYGQEVQMDAAFYIWFGDISTALHLAVDKATKKVLYGWFDYQETSKSYFILLMNTIINYGIPSGIRADKRGSFSVNNSTFFKSELNITQFGRICNDLCIRLETSSNPLFKPNVERENRTFKGRLKAELRYENITTIDEANEYLTKIFIPKMNAKFSYEINENKNSMKKNIYTKEELNIIISERYKRTIDNASSIKYKTDYYIPVDKETGEVASYSSKTECIVIVAFDGSLWCLIKDNLHKLVKIEKEKPVKVITKKESTYKGHKPTANHPWGYQQQMKRKGMKNNVKQIYSRNENR